MDTHTQKFKVRLGLFIAGGLAIFILAVFIIGKQKNLFNPVYKLTTNFRNVSGLQVGNNIRFSGITVGTVDGITIINDSTVQVEMLVRKNVKEFIKTDSKVIIGAEGLIGDKLLTISQGSAGASIAKAGQQLASSEPIETGALMASLAVTAGNAEIITAELAEVMIKVNSGQGTIGRLIQDSAIADNLSATMLNLKKSTKGLDENMEAAKHNFLLKGYFTKKAKADAKKKLDAERKILDSEEQKALEQKAIEKK
jgi:phospholipid/cholesterol/gamma-HCH transport system substrate-binding protein